MRLLALLFCCLVTLKAQLVPERDVPRWQVPKQVTDCANSLVRFAVTSIKLDYEVNPFYLSGDFDGDGFMDLAIALHGVGDSTRSGTGICRAKGPSVLLGTLAKGFVVNNEIAESVPSAGWTVVSRDGLLQVLKDSNPPRERVAGLRKKLARGKGEVIFMPYEDGDGVIIFGGSRFEWYTINSIVFPQDPPK